MVSAPQVPNIWDSKIAQLTPEGTVVRKGQPVVGFDTSVLQRELQEKTAEAESARTQLETEADVLLSTENERLRLAEAQAQLRKAEMKLQAPSDIVATNDRQKVQFEFDLARREI